MKDPNRIRKSRIKADPDEFRAWRAHVAALVESRVGPSMPDAPLERWFEKEMDARDAAQRIIHELVTKEADDDTAKARRAQAFSPVAMRGTVVSDGDVGLDW